MPASNIVCELSGDVTVMSKAAEVPQSQLVTRMSKYTFSFSVVLFVVHSNCYSPLLNGGNGLHLVYGKMEQKLFSVSTMIPHSVIFTCSNMWAHSNQQFIDNCI